MECPRRDNIEGDDDDIIASFVYRHVPPPYPA